MLRKPSNLRCVHRRVHRHKRKGRPVLERPRATPHIAASVEEASVSHKRRRLDRVVHLGADQRGGRQKVGAHLLPLRHFTNDSNVTVYYIGLAFRFKDDTYSVVDFYSTFNLTFQDYKAENNIESSYDDGAPWPQLGAYANTNVQELADRNLFRPLPGFQGIQTHRFSTYLVTEPLSFTRADSLLHTVNETWNNMFNDAQIGDLKIDRILITIPYDSTADTFGTSDSSDQFQTTQAADFLEVGVALNTTNGNATDTITVIVLKNVPLLSRFTN